MKKLIYRKLLKDHIIFFLIALISSSIIIWVFQAVNYLDIMIEDGRDYFVYIKYSLLTFPKILSRLFPFVLFFSIFYVILRHETNNELIIFWNFGIHKMKIINFMIKISLILMVMQILLSSIIVPKSQDLARSFLRTSTVNFFENFIKPQKFNDTIKGITIFSERKDEKGNLYNLYLKKENGSNDFQLTYAKKGTFKEIGNIAVLVLYNGTTITKKKEEITNFSFSKSDFPLNNVETNTTTYKKTQELSSLKLYECIKNIYFYKNENEFKKIENCTTKNLDNIFKEIYKRLIIPFYIPLLVLITFLLIVYSKENSKYTSAKIFTFFIGMFFIIFSETSIRFISNEIISNIYICFFPLVFFIIFYIKIYRNLSFN